MSTNTARPTRFYHRPAGKALLAVGAGVLLLAGAGGTFATWSDQESVGTGTITDGELSLAVTDGTWTNGEDTIDINSFRMVPGDTVTFSADVTPTIVGDNLEATLTATLLDSDLPSEDAHWNVTVVGEDEFTAVDHDISRPVTVTVELPEDSDNDSQNESLNLGDLTLTLQQKIAPTD